MPHADEPHARVAQRLPEREVVHAWQAEADVDARVLEQVDDQLRAGRHAADPLTACPAGAAKP